MTTVPISIGLFGIMVVAALFVVVALFVVWVVMRLLQNQSDRHAVPTMERVGRPAAPPARGNSAKEAWQGDTKAACPECGSVQFADSPEGLCPRCLFRRALVMPVLSPGSGANPAGHSPFVAPLPADLAPHFPQLEILTLLGQGGMGAVYKARQLKLDRFVAVKILPAEWSRDPAFAERFSREARALARLSHPHIVAVHDFGEAGGYFYLLMEYVDGANLRQILQSGPLEPRTALQFIPQICDALQYAHDEGVVHRDVKPENILVDQRGRVKIADFGLAKLVGPSRATFTLTGSYQVMGTLDYMAPEQRSRPQEVDHRADIYSLGVVFYEMLTGELPLGRFSPPSHTADVDERIDEIVHRALEREPAQRFQHVSEVRSAVESIAGAAAGPGYATPITDFAYLEFQVQGPAAALFVTALVGLIDWVVVGLMFSWANPNVGWHQDEFTVRWFLILIGAGGMALAIILGAIKLRRLENYTFVTAALILAMLPWSLHCLIGIPAAIWCFIVLARPEVKAAFLANFRRARQRGLPTPLPKLPQPTRPTGPIQRKARSFWHSFCAVFYSNPRRGESAAQAPQSAVDETPSPR